MKLKKKEITRQLAEQRTSKHRLDFKNLRKSWVQLGREVAESVDLRVPEKLGMNMRVWLTQTFGESTSKIFAELRNFRALQGVAIKDLEQIPETSATALTRLPEPQRKSPAWIEKAKSLPPVELKKQVDAELEKKGVKPDLFRTFSLTVTKEILEEMLEAEKKLAGILNLDIAMRPALRMKVWQAMAVLILTTEREHLVIELEGGDEEPAHDHIVAQACD